jgi:hypothetical protein
MAKAKTLAMLAGLAGLAYANRDKLFGKKKTYNEDAGDQKTSSYTGDTKKVAASDDRMSDRMSNEDYIKSRMKKAPEDEKGSVQSNMLNAITAPKAAPNDQAGNQGVLLSKSPTPKTTPKPKPKRPVMTDAQNTALANANKGMSQAATTAAEDEGARLGNIKAARDYNRGQEMEREVLNNMITNPPMKKGGMVKMASGGMTASRRGDGIASRGKTRGKIC